MQNRLDDLFLGACDNHDRCWRRCNGQFPPYLGLEHRRSCDGRFLLDMEAACAAWSVVLAYPGSGWSDPDDFLENCSVIAATFAAAVSNPLATRIFWGSQCFHGCNPDGCALAPAEWNPFCGRGHCYYYSFPDPSPGDPPEPEDPCINPDSQLSATTVEGDPLLLEGMPSSNYPLLRHDHRDGFRYRMEEWAVLSVEVGENGSIVDIAVESSSTPAYGNFQRRVLHELSGRSASSRGMKQGEKPQAGRSVVLMVHQPPHRHDDRWIESPQALLDTTSSATARVEGRAVVRADYAEDRSVIDLRVLYSDRPVAAEELDLIREGLRLEHASDQPHRVVLFAVVRLGSAIALEDDLTVLPRCCPDDPSEL